MVETIDTEHSETHITGDISTSLSDSTVSFEDDSERGSNALLARAWTPGWRNADRALMAFLNGPLINYSTNRKKADGSSTSLLSPHLHFGELSVRKVFHLVRMKQLVWTNEGNKDGEESCSLFLRSIGLREYSRYIIVPVSKYQLLFLLTQNLTKFNTGKGL